MNKIISSVMRAGDLGACSRYKHRKMVMVPGVPEDGSHDILSHITQTFYGDNEQCFYIL
jgi:hypothetical protein